jgi:hypothetical protein
MKNGLRQEKYQQKYHQRISLLSVRPGATFQAGRCHPRATVAALTKAGLPLTKTDTFNMIQMARLTGFLL